MHSPPWDTMGDAVTRWMELLPSSPIAQRRCRKVSYLTGLSRRFLSRGTVEFLLDLNRSMHSAYPDPACGRSRFGQQKSQRKRFFTLKYGRGGWMSREATWRSADERIYFDSDHASKETCMCKS